VESEARSGTGAVYLGADIESGGQIGLGQRLSGRAVTQNASVVQHDHPVGELCGKLFDPAIVYGDAPNPTIL